MKYNAKCDIWVSKEGLIYRYDEDNDKLILCKTRLSDRGYEILDTKLGIKKVHRIVWETFNGEIPKGYEIDHIEGDKTDNRLKMLRCVTHKGNMNNPLTKQKIQRTMSSPKMKEKLRDLNRGKIKSEFGRKFKEHYGLSNYENPKLYHTEREWYRRHNKVCRWEVDEQCKS